MRAGPRLSQTAPMQPRLRPGRRFARRDLLGWLTAAGGLAVGLGVGGIGLLGIARKLAQMAAPPAPASKGSISSTKQPPNSAKAFANPHNGQASLVIRLPNGTFVAYEQACTHKGVYVDYDQASHCLVCPAHGAIFDPAKGGSVRQGPATRALPSVALKINPDGTITPA